jgi:hypothetical protein
MNQISYTLGPGRCLCRGDTQMGCQPVYINGAGETGRDFYFIDNAVQANLLAIDIFSITHIITHICV